MFNRRVFITKSVLAAAGFSIIANKIRAGILNGKLFGSNNGKPLVISTWKHGLDANETAWKIISEGGTALDASEKGVMVVEEDPNSKSVGYGGLPDRDGYVTLDASIMDYNGNCGSVCFIRDIKHPVSVARMVMEKTPHVMLAGDGARQFALNNGFELENLLTKASKKDWEKWKQKAKYQPEVNFENHDTIGLIALDEYGHIAGACTTSGMPYKMHGRVGDSPIIGAGLYVDGNVGAAAATGHGEYVMKTLGSFLIVELMRNGMSPENACKEAVRRIERMAGEEKGIQVGFLAVKINGEYGTYALRKGFKYALFNNTKNKLYNSGFLTE